MKETDLEAIAKYLCGERWETPLAGLLGVSTGDLRDWRAGQPMPPEHEADLIDRVAARQLEQAWPAIEEQFAVYGEPEGIDLKVYREGSNVVSPHARPWSNAADLQIIAVHARIAHCPRERVRVFPTRNPLAWATRA